MEACHENNFLHECLLSFSTSLFWNSEKTMVQKFDNDRAYPGSEFVVANTLAKRKKLEPNEISLSQGFSQKVSTS